MTKNKKGSEVVRALKSIFARHEIPEKIRSDNGPPFDSMQVSMQDLQMTGVSMQDLQMTGDLKSPQVAQNFPD